jgi:hypothetical protein
LVIHPFFLSIVIPLAFYPPLFHIEKLPFFIIFSCVRLSPLGTAATTGLLYQLQMIDAVIVE